MNMTIDIPSAFAIPAMVVIFITGLFGLSDVKPLWYAIKNRERYWPDLILGMGFFYMASGSLFLIMDCLEGNRKITIPGAIMLWGIAIVLFMIGRFAPWKRWIRSVEKVA